MENKSKKRMQPVSIRSKTFSYLLGFCIVLLLILWLFQTVLLDSFYKNIKTRKVKQDAQTMVELITTQSENHLIDLQELLDAMASKADVDMELWFPEMGVYINSWEHPSDTLTVEERRMAQEKYMTLEDWYSLIKEAQANGGEATVYTSGGSRAYGKEQEKIHHARIVQTKNSLSLLVVSTNLLPVDSTVETLRYQLVVVSAIMVVLSVALAWAIAHQVSKPIADLNESAKKLGQGDYTVQFDGTGYREIEELSATLSHTTEELSKTDLLRKELVANVSHDLRTPLTLITGYSEMMRDFPEEYSAENLQVIVDESKRLTTLVSDLLDLSKLQAGMHEPKPEIFNLTELTEEIISRYAIFREHDNYQIVFDAAGDILVYADPARISQVIYNLIANAINYTGEDKTVTVRQSKKGNRVWIEIIDSGVGMSDEALSHVWSRYYRDESTHNRAVTGSGLGLSIVQTIFEQHPGIEYGVFSQKGSGSNFWFSLPIVDEE